MSLPPLAAHLLVIGGAGWRSANVYAVFKGYPAFPGYPVDCYGVRLVRRAP